MRAYVMELASSRKQRLWVHTDGVLLSADVLCFPLFYSMHAWGDYGIAALTHSSACLACSLLSGLESRTSSPIRVLFRYSGVKDYLSVHLFMLSFQIPSVVVSLLHTRSLAVSLPVVYHHLTDEASRISSSTAC